MKNRNVLLNIDTCNFLQVSTENQSEVLHEFDIAVIEMNVKDKKYVLFQDFLNEGIKSFYNILCSVMKNELQIDEATFESGIGFLWNNCLYEIAKDNFEAYDPSEKYNLWDTSKEHSTATWMYNYNNKIYIEVSSVFNGDFDNEGSYQTFLKNYKIILQKEIDINLVNYWIDFCKKINIKLSKGV